MAVKAAGEDCEEDEECEDGHRCLPDTDVCTAVPGEGESCEDTLCDHGFWCEEDTRLCRSEYLPAGEACIDRRDCDGFCNADTGTCETCSSNDDCEGYECHEGSCSGRRLSSEDQINDTYCID
jgi:hypothetical protein